MTLRRERLLLLSAAILVLTADQLSKLWIVSHIPVYTPVSLFPWLNPILSLTYVTNTGISFGLFPQLGDFFTWLNAAVVVSILWFQRSLTTERIGIYLSLGLVIGGAVGNLTDRILRGAVVDFLDVNFWPFKNFPIFNLADSCILIGVTILLLHSFLTETSPQEQPQEVEATLDA